MINKMIQRRRPTTAGVLALLVIVVLTGLAVMEQNRMLEILLVGELRETAVLEQERELKTSESQEISTEAALNTTTNTADLPSSPLGHYQQHQSTQTAELWNHPLTLNTRVPYNESFLIKTRHYSSNHTCLCDLISVDCLASIECMMIEESPLLAASYMVLGIYTRQAIKDYVTFSSRTDEAWGYAPFGKTLQYLTIGAWKRWTTQNRLPYSMHLADRSQFVNQSWYSECQSLHLFGKACFFQFLNATEDVHELEQNAMRMVENARRNDISKDSIAADVKSFRRQIQEDINNSSSTRLSALSYLLSFAHVARMRFNLRPFLLDIYNRRLQKMIHHNNTSLRITLHLRRADACGHKQARHYATTASPLESPAQTSGKRMCYATSVYMEALRRAIEYSKQQHVEVYLTTDHAGSVIQEIQRDYSDLYQACNWYFLDYFSEKTFQYEGFIEMKGMDSSQQARLGESAVADLFHASHGQVFIGHLGSRFGKISYLLMTARHGRFVPFFTPDGHSYCCEIDEDCGRAKRFIPDMENCLTFSHEMVKDIPMNKEPGRGYWDVGSRKREEFVKRQEELKQERDRKRAKRYPKLAKMTTTSV